ncbi:hypothetical protein CROQUDRAFT_101523 [Cronartium quercuum f. sp. fusiforme G11]|uniref:Uncharacterized protein n=1 Tax=Cronartium quercuum f. sp. fusiforme G11 TaxID=708437 RepID=A0A9P6T541_9BASI|nr:hypothetical protein CROQUDRAFT_101523 [Cronartium quercuum f. sp. fusiforme G11]
MVRGVDKIDDHLSTGPNGIELMLKWIGQVHAHQTWKGNTTSNSILRIKLEKVCQKLEDAGAKEPKAERIFLAMLEASALAGQKQHVIPKSQVKTANIAKKANNYVPPKNDLSTSCHSYDLTFKTERFSAKQNTTSTSNSPQPAASTVSLGDQGPGA